MNASTPAAHPYAVEITGSATLVLAPTAIGILNGIQPDEEGGPARYSVHDINGGDPYVIREHHTVSLRTTQVGVLHDRCDCDPDVAARFETETQALIYAQHALSRCWPCTAQHPTDCVHCANRNDQPCSTCASHGIEPTAPPSLAPSRPSRPSPQHGATRAAAIFTAAVNAVFDDDDWLTIAVYDSTSTQVHVTGNLVNGELEFAPEDMEMLLGFLTRVLARDPRPYGVVTVSAPYDDGDPNAWAWHLDDMTWLTADQALSWLGGDVHYNKGLRLAPDKARNPDNTAVTDEVKAILSARGLNRS